MSLNRTFGYWNAVFGARLDSETSKLIVVPHQAVAGYHDYRGYHGAFALQRGKILAVSVPSSLLDQVKSLAALQQTLDLQSLLEIFAEWSVRSVGPALQAYLDPHKFRPVLQPEARALTADDIGLISPFQENCDPVAWSHSGIALGDEGLFGCFDGAMLVSLAKLLPWNDLANNVGVVTHPNYRGRGYGAAAVSAVVATALEADKLVFYQTLKSNVAAVNLAKKLGFERFGESLSVRFRAEI